MQTIPTDAQQVAHQRLHVVRDHQMQHECSEMTCGANALEVLRLHNVIEHFASNLMNESMSEPSSTIKKKKTTNKQILGLV